MKPIAIISDTHLHNWHAFHTTNADGVNSRLQIILDEIERCAETLVGLGGDSIIHAGDLFHVRGSVAPTVLNPARMALERIGHAYGVSFYIMPGNHDMELKSASIIGDSIQAVGGQHVVVAHGVSSSHLGYTLVPWIEDLNLLKQTIEDKNMDRDNMLIIHAPVDGVIMGIPDHGLSPSYLASLGYKNVFAGHYHNHKDFGNGVYSIGSTTHLTWSDVDTKAGFIIVSDSGVKHYASHAPSFIEIDSEMDDYEIKCLVDGNYVRTRVNTGTSSRSVAEIRDFLMQNGARGVSIMTVKQPTVKRATTSIVKPGSSLEAAVGDFIKSKSYSFPAEVTLRSQKILAEASVA